MPAPTTTSHDPQALLPQLRRLIDHYPQLADEIRRISDPTAATRYVSAAARRLGMRLNEFALLSLLEKEGSNPDSVVG